jgi:hypothetical protein
MMTKGEFLNRFQRQPDGAWCCTKPIKVDGPSGPFTIRQGVIFNPGALLLGLDLAKELDRLAAESASRETRHSDRAESSRLVARQPRLPFRSKEPRLSCDVAPTIVHPQSPSAGKAPLLSSGGPNGQLPNLLPRIRPPHLRRLSLLVISC